jgi:sirohydrochlorin ferrochelatase
MTMANTETRSARGVNGQQGGSSAREQIREVKDQVVGQAKNSLQQARDRASSSLGESKRQFAEQISAVADALRRTTEHLRSEDQARIAGLTETLAQQVDQVANYLRSKDATAMKTDLESLARRQPALLLGGALVLGLIGARFLKSSERGRDRRRTGSDRERHLGYGRSKIGEGDYPAAEGGLGGSYAGA